MFDIGFPELLIVSVVALLVLGPERLPEALRTLGQWIGRMRRSFQNIKAEIEREIGTDEIRREIYNESVMEQSRKFKGEIQSIVDDFNEPIDPDHPTVKHGPREMAGEQTTQEPLPAAPSHEGDHPDSAER